MSVSTDGQICYGVIIKEDSRLPWEKFDDDPDSWWIEGVLGFKHSFELFDENGRWIDEEGTSKALKDKYFQERRDFEAKNEKLPYKIVNYCSGDYPMYILAIKRTCMSASRGYPEKFDPQQLDMISQEEDVDLYDFCKKYKIKIKGKSAWYLSSYWG